MTEYSSHDWRKNTDDAVVVDEHDTVIRPVNDLKVRFKHPKSLKFEEVILKDRLEHLGYAGNLVKMHEVEEQIFEIEDTIKKLVS